MKVSLEVQIFNNQSCLTISEAKVNSLVNEVVSFENKNYNEVSIHFVDKSTISEMHARYFDDPTSTDCISFPMDDDDSVGYKVLGEVFVCPEVAVEYANLNSLQPQEELTLYIVHGLLHLMGYDDLEEEKCQLMRKAEQRHMENLKSLNLLLD